MAPIETRKVTRIITSDKASELIKGNGNKFFWTAFVRKGDKKVKDAITGERRIVARKGSIRYMNCQTGVRKHLKTESGSGRKYSFKEHRLTSVYDRKARGYRSFAWDNMVALRVKGIDYVVLNEVSRNFCKDNPNHEMSKMIVGAGIEV